MGILSYIHWNFNPAIFHIGEREIRWYGLMFAISFLLGYKIVEKQFKYEKENLAWLEPLLTYIVVATVIGARLGHVIFYGWSEYAQHPIEIIKVWKGGLASHGGAAGIFVALWIFSRKYTKRNIFWIIDRVVIPTALAAMFIRLGNLWNSEIYGVQTNLPWGFIFERVGEKVPKHPTQLYEALSYLLIFIILQWMYWKTDAKSKTGLISGVFFVLLFTARFLIEFVKEVQEPFEKTMIINRGQQLSIPFILLGIGLIIWALRKKKTT